MLSRRAFVAGAAVRIPRRAFLASAAAGASVFLLMALSTVYAAELDVCRQDRDFEQRLSACTSLLESKAAPSIEQAQILVYRGIAFRSLNKLDLAISDFDRALTLNPRLTSALINRGNAHLAANNIDLSITDYSQAIDQTPLESFFYVYRANAIRIRGQTVKGGDKMCRMAA